MEEWRREASERVGVYGSLVALQREIRLDRRRKEVRRGKTKDRMVTGTATDRPTHAPNYRRGKDMRA